MDRQQLKELIEKVRKEMEQEFENGNHEESLKKSQELDLLIVKYLEIAD